VAINGRDHNAPTLRKAALDGALLSSLRTARVEREELHRTGEIKSRRLRLWKQTFHFYRPSFSRRSTSLRDTISSATLGIAGVFVAAVCCDTAADGLALLSSGAPGVVLRGAYRSATAAPATMASIANPIVKARIRMSFGESKLASMQETQERVPP